jgi:hypothetical protein
VVKSEALALPLAVNSEEKHFTSEPVFFWSRPKFDKAHVERKSAAQQIGSFCSVMQIKTATKDSSLLGCYAVSFGGYRCSA